MFRYAGRHRKWQAVLKNVTNQLGTPADLVLRSIAVKGTKQRVYCLYLQSVADRDIVNQYILEPVRDGTFEETSADLLQEHQFVKELRFSTTPEQELEQRIVKDLVNSHCVLVDLQNDRVVSFPCIYPQHRQVEEPKSETVIRGPHEGFTESLETNIGLIRKRLHNPKLRLDLLLIGDETHSKVIVAYISGLAPDQLVQEVKRRIRSIPSTAVLETAYIEEYIQDGRYSVFPTLISTEKPDVVTARLLEGKVAIMVDGAPGALLAPVTFFEFFASPEDYYQRADIATFVRWIRFVSFLMAVLVPATYVATTTFHPELLPTPLVISLAAQMEGSPLPTLVEVLVMEIIFEIIREAGLRTPRSIGQALSIVGAIVLGQSAVQAGLISASVVIVVSVTAIANFVVPVYDFGIAQRLLRFTFLILGGFMGLFGVLCGLLFLVAHLVSLESFGVPFMSPAVPFHFADWKDTFVRAPRPHMERRRLPQSILNLTKKK